MHKNDGKTSNRNIAKWFSKVIDNSKITTVYGVDAEKLSTILQTIKSEILQAISVGLKITATEVSELEKAIEQKVLGEICAVNANVSDIKLSIETKIEDLTRSHKNVVAEIKNDYLGLSQQIVDLKTCFERLNDRYAWGNSQNISEQILNKLTDNRDIELQTGKNCLLNAEFEGAIDSLAKVVNANNIENRGEAYFCLALAENKVQPIWDYSEDTFIPICYKYFIDFSSDSNYKKAVAYITDKSIKSDLEMFATEIDETAKCYRELQKNRITYDCFICLKVTDTKTGKKTKDNDWLVKNKLWERLNKQEKISTFYSEQDCKNLKKGSSLYNAHIQYALFNAKVMILLCSSEDYLYTPWVENEWSRFRYHLKTKGEIEDKIVIVFDGNSINLPFRQEYQDYDRSDGIDNLIKVIKSRLADAQNYVFPNYKYCSSCGERHAFDTMGSCNRCGQQLIDSNTYLNSLVIKLRQVIEDKSSECKSLREELEESQKRVNILEHGESELTVNREVEFKPPVVESIQKQSTKFKLVNSIVNRKWLSKIPPLENSIEHIIKQVPISERELYKKPESELKKLGYSIVVENNIVESQFAGQEKLLSVVISKGVTSIGENAFLGCKRLIRIYIPDSVKTIGKNAFAYCSNYLKIYFETEQDSEWHDYSKDDWNPHEYTIMFGFGGKNAKWARKLVVIPETDMLLQDERSWPQYYDIDEKNAVLRRYSGKHKEITIPNGIKTIGYYALSGCDSLESIILPKEVEFIAEDAFFSCQYLESITIGNRLKKICYDAFANCSNLTQIIFLGTIDEWRAVVKDKSWDSNTGNYVVRCSNGTVSKQNKSTIVI